jgi:hypothetical protein
VDNGAVTEQPAHDLFGRDRLVAALGALVDRIVAGQRVTAFVTGEAGIGKTSLLRVVASHAIGQGVVTAWGTCLDLEGAPGYWPWTQALEGLVRTGGDSVLDGLGDDAGLIATILPSAGRTPSGASSERDRLLAMDATRRLLETQARIRPVLVVLDDLQWADPSSLALIELVARSSDRAPLGLLGAYRDNELSPATRQRLSSLMSSSEHYALEGLDVEAARALVERTAGARVTSEVAEAVHRRTGGHPFFVRELALLGALTGGALDRVPSAVRDAIERRVERLPEATITVLEAAALIGVTILPDVVAAALGRPGVDVEDALRPAAKAGILTTRDSETRFAHDLLRETLLDRVEGARQVELHRGIGAALEERHERGIPVAPSELARHFIAAVPLDGPHRAVRWALAAAEADRSSLAFAEAAGHLRRLRSALGAAPTGIEGAVMVRLLVAEADALVRAGVTVDARGLLRHAAEVAARSGDPDPIAMVALATAQLGARFATRRDEIIVQLDQARAAMAGVDDAIEARLTATLARELQHSVAEDRPRAVALSERALELGRRAGEPLTLLDCLLARHDVLWHPGAGGARAEIAREIVEVAITAGEEERQAEGLLLQANALLEQGSPAFEGPLESCLAILDGLGQPRHRYTSLTRRACVALLRGDLERAEGLIDDAKELGERILEPDAGNVYMSQRLELVRARGDADELSIFAAAAVAHWTGAPIHAHAVAAGFLARAGDLVAAERHVATVVDLGTWRADRSYLWSVFVRELAYAAVRLGQRELCRELLDDLRPLGDSCGVNGAVVAFAGSHAQTAGLLASATGERELADLLFEDAASTYRRLGAMGWAADPRSGVRVEPVPGRTEASMRRRGPVWHLRFGGHEATVAHTKGLGDIARLLASPASEIHALELFDAPVRAASAGAITDRQALASYRRRLADLDAEIDDAERLNDPERRAGAEAERQALLDEVGRVTGTGGRLRPFANYPAERARKAVTARVRDAIRKLEPVLPELAVHLERTIVTGTSCRYRPDTVDWRVDSGEH